MSDHLDRAAKVLWEATCPDGLRAAMRPDCWAMAQALDEAGMLASPERDAAVAAQALRKLADEVGNKHASALFTGSAYRPSGWGDFSIFLHNRADVIEREAGEPDAER